MVWVVLNDLLSLLWWQEHWRVRVVLFMAPGFPSCGECHENVFKTISFCKTIVLEVHCLALPSTRLILCSSLSPSLSEGFWLMMGLFVSQVTVEASLRAGMCALSFPWCRRIYKTVFPVLLIGQLIWGTLLLRHWLTRLLWWASWPSVKMLKLWMSFYVGVWGHICVLRRVERPAALHISVTLSGQYLRGL